MEDAFVLLLRAIKIINWTGDRCAFSLLMIEIQPSPRTAHRCLRLRRANSCAAKRPGQSPEQIGMKLAGFLLLLSGWGIVVSTLPLLPSSGERPAFVLAGTAVELIGLTFVARSHRVP